MNYLNGLIALINPNLYYRKSINFIKNLTYLNYLTLFIIISVILRLLSINHANLIAEEAYYWNYSEHLDFSYLDHPPIVALLIKFSTSILGTNELGVRLSTLFCWGLSSYFSFKLSNLISKDSGLYALFLLAILPFFFIHSLIITPDAPLTACWSATIYCLYRAIILDESNYWYKAGFWLGIGMLSKYTIILLGPTTLIFLCINPKYRSWFARKEPYLCALITILFFTPVIYWNYKHDWASFIFQSVRRIEDTYSFSLHHFFGLLFLFLLPAGTLAFIELFKKHKKNKYIIDKNNKKFIQVYTLIPLIVFAAFSLTHDLKFNWIGPSLLAIIPWIAIIIKDNKNTSSFNIRSVSIWGSALVLFFYAFILIAINFGKPETFYKNFFSKYIAWDNFTKDIQDIAFNVSKDKNLIPVIVPLDTYYINSELRFYQTKLFKNGESNIIYPIIGRHIFGNESLMYRYWEKKNYFSGKTLILISNNLNDFNNPNIKERTVSKSKLFTIWAKSPYMGVEITPYYYQIVQMLG